MIRHTRTFAWIVLAALLVPATATAFHRDDLTTVYSATGAGSASYAVKYDHGGGDFAIDLYSTGPATAQSISLAAFVFNANRQVVFGFAFTGHTSPERLILSPAGVSGHVDLVPEWLDMSVSTSDADAACSFMCVGLSGSNVPAGTYYYLLWIAGASASSFEVRARNGGSATVNVGPAWSIGDAEIHGGAFNAQVQDSGVGVKAMVGAGETIHVADNLYGFWGASDFKLGCSFALGVCVWKSGVVYQCSYLTGQNCDTTRISWSGPAGSGSGRSLYAFLGTPPGDYAFTVDSKVDAYGPSYYDPATRTFVLLGENYSYLTAADNALPA